MKACAVHPCELSDGVCQNGGTCVEVAAVGGRAVPFHCQCVGNFGGKRCETDLCGGVDCGDHGQCVAGACADVDECDGLTTDAQALLAWRDGLSAVPDGCPVAQWGGDDACGWEGVDCGDCVHGVDPYCRRYWADAEHGRRVTAVYTYPAYFPACGGIVGTLSPCLARLEYLRYLELYQIPGLSGPVPAEMIDGLPHLDYQLTLSSTAVDGPSCHRACDSHPQLEHGCRCP